MKKAAISFEYFPPKSEAGAKMLWEAVPRLAALKPDFMTVTYGAGGSNREGTMEALKRMMRETGLPLASHYTYINTTRAQAREHAQELWDMGIRHIVALRGDMPKDLSWPLDPDGDYFQYTSDFVNALREWYPFEISVGAYPEKHPDAPNLQADIDALRKKCDAGAARAITQFFFDNRIYYDFIEQCAAAGITTPIVPGLVPVHDYKGLIRFATNCKASLPDWLHERFASLEDKPDEARKVATELLTSQAMDLIENGVPHIHFYTLNKAPITLEACGALGYCA